MAGSNRGRPFSLAPRGEEWRNSGEERNRPTLPMPSETQPGAGKLHENLRVPREAIADFCRRHHIRKLSLFGSVLRPDFSPRSDIDVLVEYEPGGVPGFAFIDHQDELSVLLGRRVDLITPNGLSRLLRQQVLDEAEVMYVAA